MRFYAPHKLPTQSDIKAKMLERYPNIKKLVEPIIDQCAEEAESVILQIWAETVTTRPKVNGKMPRIVYFDPHKASCNFQYKCSSCMSRKLRVTYNFCPDCGVPIEWKERIGQPTVIPFSQVVKNKAL